MLEQLFAFRNLALGTSKEDIEQFLRGYYNVVVAAAAGDESVREQYLQAVVPGIKSAGMGLPTVMDGMVRVAMVMAHEVEPRFLPWLMEFTSAYTMRLAELWEA